MSTHTNFSFLFVWSLTNRITIHPPTQESLKDLFSCWDMNFNKSRWHSNENRDSSHPDRPKIEISWDRRTVTGSCFLGVPCQPSCKVSALFTPFLLKCSAPQTLVYTYRILQDITSVLLMSVYNCGLQNRAMNLPENNQSRSYIQFQECKCKRTSQWM